MMTRTLPYAVELDGTILSQHDGQLSPLANLSDIKGDCKVVTDFQDAMTRTMTVEADTRYIELMISRKLQEAGEFDEPVTVITHWKKKRGKNLSDIFFTALPAKRYFQYVELVSEHKDYLVVLPVQSVLFSILKKYGTNFPVAVVFQHGRFADVLVGTKQKVWYANKVVAYDDSEEQIGALWETVRTDIETAGQEHRQMVKSVYVGTWVDSGPIPQWTGEGDPNIIPLEESIVSRDEQEVFVSLPKMLHSASAGQAVASTSDKVFYGARRMMPVLNMFLVLAALVVGAMGFWYQMQASGRQERIDAVYEELIDIRAKAPDRIEQVPYESTLAFTQKLWASRKLPTYRQILADVGQGMGGSLKVENIKADYTDDKVTIKAFGTANGPFEASYKAFQALRKRLSGRGYQLLEERFDTRINSSDFVLQFIKELR